MSSSQELVNVIWSIADLLRGDFKQSEYRRFILPLVVLRRLDCLIEHTKSEAVRKGISSDEDEANAKRILAQTAAGNYYNASPLDFSGLLDDPHHIGSNLSKYIHGFSKNVQQIIESFEFNTQIGRLDKKRLLYPVIARLASVDLYPSTVSNEQMGHVFEELTRRFSQLSAETKGEHYTPRDVIRLMVSLILAPDDEDLSLPSVGKTVYDPACGTGGILAEVQKQITDGNRTADVRVHGQEIDSETHAICCSDMMLKGMDFGHIKLGNSLSDDQHANSRRELGFDYMMANPPLGAEWKSIRHVIEDERDHLGFVGRFGAGTPRINDGSFLFLQHMLSKMKPAHLGGSRIGIIFNASPMYIGAAGSGESEIRRWILENDWLETIVALPDQLFYHTSIPTYFWILSNRKSQALENAVLLIDGREYCSKMRRSVSNKRKQIDTGHITELNEIYLAALRASADPNHLHDADMRICATYSFGYQRITVERPLKLRFEVSKDALSTIRDAKPLAANGYGRRLASALRPLVGSVWQTKHETFDGIRRVAVQSGLPWPPSASALNAIRSAVSVKDLDGEIQTVGDKPEPDADLRDYENVPLTAMQSSSSQLLAEVDAYMRHKVLEQDPDAWVDHTKTTIGFGISRLLFSSTGWGEPFEPLRRFARQVPARPVSTATELQLPVLRTSDLNLVSLAADLSESPDQGQLLARCSGGDLVGSGSNWRLLPHGFGTALTSLNVLRPTGNKGRVLCEWLNSSRVNDFNIGRRPSSTDPVPSALIADFELDQLLEDLHDGRRILAETTSRILPNIFDGPVDKLDSVRRAARAAASEARLAKDLVRPLEDPVWRAEWSYPYHVAALARQYRIASTPESRKETCLKLGEGIARILGILSLAVLIGRRGSFSSDLQRQFRIGATFGTWLRLIKLVLAEGPVSELPELERTVDPAGAYGQLAKLHAFRNFSGHAHGVRSRYEVQSEVDQLEPILLSIVDTVGWLSGLSWNLVEQCRYTANGYLLLGERLRGSNPEWEPFQQLVSSPFVPERLYAEGPSSNTSIDLWPVASVDLCQEENCRTRELFLFDSVERQTLVLRSLREHSIRLHLT